MTERTEVRWNFTSRSTRNIIKDPNPAEFDITIFNVGGGHYTDYKYTIPANGTYLVGYSVQAGAQTNCLYYLVLERNSVITNIDQVRITAPTTGITTVTTFNKTILHNFLEDDKIYIVIPQYQGNLRYNFAPAPEGDDVFNSFWSIRLDY